MVTCSHCNTPMPPDRDGHEIATGWTVVRVEEHGKERIEIAYLYVCPRDMITVIEKQVPLFVEKHPTPETTCESKNSST